VEAPADVRFYFDLASVESYLLAERILDALAIVAEWQPVLRDRLPGPSAETARCVTEAEVFRVELARRAAQASVQPLQWPRAWPELDSGQAMLAATYAKSIGRTVAFSQAAFRQIFAGGRDPADADTLVIAGAACEIHPRALLNALSLQSTARALGEATAAAAELGVRDTPAVSVGAQVFHGEAELALAAAAAEQALPAQQASVDQR
jgi:2-hydroxychromene-2-carboxylate isomerase